MSVSTLYTASEIATMTRIELHRYRAHQDVPSLLIALHRIHAQSRDTKSPEQIADSYATILTECTYAPLNPYDLLIDPCSNFTSPASRHAPRLLTSKIIARIEAALTH